MPEELGFDEAGAHGGAVEYDEGLAGPVPFSVEPARDELLTRPRFADHEHALVVPGEALEPGEEGSHGNARSEHLTEADLPTERDRLPRPRRHHLGTTPAKCDHGSHRTVPVEHARPVDVEAVFAPQISYANALLGQAHAKVTP